MNMELRIFQAPPTCLLVPVGRRHLCLLPFHLWRCWVQTKQTSNPVRTDQNCNPWHGCILTSLPLKLPGWFWKGWHCHPFDYRNECLTRNFFDTQIDKYSITCSKVGELAVIARLKTNPKTISGHSCQWRKLEHSCQWGNFWQALKVPEECSFAPAVAHLYLFPFPWWRCGQTAQIAKMTRLWFCPFPSWRCRWMELAACPGMAAGSQEVCTRHASLSFIFRLFMSHSHIGTCSRFYFLSSLLNYFRGFPTMRISTSALNLW